MSSTMVKLEKVCDVIRGVTFKPEDLVPPFTENSIVVMRTKNVQVKGLDYEDLISIPIDLIKDQKKVLIDGDLLISSANSWYLVGKTSFFETNKLASPVTAGGFISIIRPKASIKSKYLYHWLTTDKSQHKIRHLGRQTTNISNLDFKQFKKLEIPLPSLPEQQRIADILDKAEAINQKREQALALCDEFLRATFLDMFGHHFSSKGYPSSTKKSIALLTDYIDYRGKTPKKTEYGIPLITAKNVRKGYVDEEPREFISEDLYDDWMTRGLPLKNDVLFTTEAPLGNVALLGEYEKVAVGQRLVSLRCKEEVTPIYFMYALLDRYTQQLIFQRSSGSTVKGIRTKELYQIEIPTPPIELQQKFSSIAEKINGIKTRIQEAQELPLFDALSQQAFKGELTL